MKNNYESPKIEIVEFYTSIYSINDNSEVINPAPDNFENTGWLPWV